MLIKTIRNCSAFVLPKTKKAASLLRREVQLHFIEPSAYQTKSFFLPYGKYFSNTNSQYESLLSSARDLREKGNLDDALVSYLEAEKKLLEASNEPTPTKMKLKVEIASLYEQRGDIKPCLDLLFEASDISKACFGEKDMETGRIFARIASSYDQAGLVFDSLQAKLAAQNIFSQVEHKMEPDYLGKFYISLAKSYADNHQFDRSIEAALKGIHLLEKIPENIDLVATAYSNMSFCALSLRNYTQSIEYAQKAVDILSSSHGKDSVMLYSALANLGQCHDRAKNYSESIEVKMRALELAQKHAGQDSSLTANAYNNLGYTYYLMKEHEKALEFYNKARETTESVLGESHPATLDIYLNIGSLLLELKEFDQAMEFFNKYLNGVEEGEGDKKSEEYYRGLTLRARVHQGKGSLIAAIEDLKLAVEIAGQVHGAEGIELQYLYLHLARALMAAKEFESASDALDKAKKICEKHFSEDSVEKGLLLEAMAECKARQGKGTEAINLAKISIAILQAHLPSKHPAILANQRLIEYVQSQGM